MNKFLLKTLAIISVIGGGHTSENVVAISSSLNVVAGNTLILQNADRYRFVGDNSSYPAVTITGSTYMSEGAWVNCKSTLIVRKPVEILQRSSLQMNGAVEAFFEDGLTIGSDEGSTTWVISSGANNSAPAITIKGKFTYYHKLNLSASYVATKINLKKKDEEPRAIFDISMMGNTQAFSLPVDGNNESFLEYYNAEIDAADNANLLPSLDTLKNFQPVENSTELRDNLITSLRTRIKARLSGNILNLLNMKIQDYLAKGDNGGVTLFDTNKVKFDIDNVETLIASDDDTNNAVENKSGLTLVKADGTGVIDFYTLFNEQDGNGLIPNTEGNTFVQWTDAVKLPLSNSTSENTDFEFKTNLAPSEGNERDLYLTGGEQAITTVKFTGNNNTFKNKVVLNDSLKNVEFGPKDGCVPIDATNVTDSDISLKIQDGEGNRVVYKNTFLMPPVINSNQKVSLTVGDGEMVYFLSNDSSAKTYNFDKFTVGSGSCIQIGEYKNINSHIKNITLII